MATFDGEALLITLDPVVDGVLDVDVGQDLYTEWKNWMLAGNMRYPAAFRTTGGDPLTSIINAGSYFFIRNDLGWRIKSYENDATYFLVGNLAAQTTTLPVFNPTDGAFTAAILGLQPVTQGVTPVMAAQLEFNAFNGGVAYDVINGIAGTGTTSDGHPIGTLLNPSNNFEDTLVIAASRGFNTIFVNGDATIDSGLTYDDFVFIGQGQNLSLFTITGAASVINCTFFEAGLQGTLDGQSHIEDCDILDLNFVSGVIERCILSGTITLGGDQEALLINCESGVPGEQTPTIDCGGSGQPLALRRYSGGIELVNKTGDDPMSLDVFGTVILDRTILGQNLKVRGQGELVNNALANVNTDFFEETNKTNEASDKVSEMHQNDGLTFSIPMTVDKVAGTRISGDIKLVLTGDGINTTTVTREFVPATLVDELGNFVVDEFENNIVG